MKGEAYWNTKNKIYFLDRKEWKDYDDVLPSTKSGIIKFKKINHPITYDFKELPTSLYFPVTGPKQFRKAITWIKIQNNDVLLFKDVPFDITDTTASVPSLVKLIKEQLKQPDPVLLELRFTNGVKYQEIKDSSRTRGELFWNSKRKFYFINKEDWEMAQNEAKLHCLHKSELNLRHLNIKHKTYFDKSRDTYFKNI